MDDNKTITKAEKVFKRHDGSEAKVTATASFGVGFEKYIDVYVHRRESSNHEWVLCSKMPHPEAKSMSVDDYIKHGRSEMLQIVSPAEILKVTSLIGKPVDEVDVILVDNISSYHQNMLDLTSLLPKDDMVQEEDGFFRLKP